MSDVKSQTRRERARETRRRIVRAAHAEFVTSGYHGTTMAAVAKCAEVAVQTVYFTFHTKPELLIEVFDTAVLGDGPALPPHQTDWFRAAIAEPDPRQALRRFIAGNAEILRRVAALHAAVRTAAATDEDIDQIHAQRETLRVDGYRAFLGQLTGLQHEVDTAADVLLTLAGPETYLAFTAGRGWIHEQYLDWASEAIPRLLVPNSAEPVPAVP